MLRGIRGRLPEALVALGLLLGAGVLAGILVSRHGAGPAGRTTTAVAPSATAPATVLPATAAPAPTTTPSPPAPAQPVDFRVTALTPSSATLDWRTAAPTVGNVAFGPPSVGQARWLPPSPSATQHEVVLGGLALASTYRVWLTSVASGGQQAQATLDLTTPTPSGSVAASTKAGAVLLDGQPWFPLMVYGECSALYPSSLQAGITLFAENPCGGLQAQLDALAGHALSAGVAGESGGTGPGLIGTFYPDEADGHGYTGPLLPQLPPGLGLLTLTSHFYSGADPLPRGRGVYASLVARADVIGFDLYPLQGWCQASRLADVYGAQQELVRLAAGKPTFQWIEAAGMNCPTDPSLAVTPDSVRAEAWLAIAGGAHGLGFFPAAWTGDVGGAIARVAAEVAALGPALLGPPLPTSVEPAGSSVRAAAWSAGGALYVVAVNAGFAPAHATIRVAGLGGRPLDVLGEGRRAVASGGMVGEDFAPLAVHLYVAPPAGG